MILFFDEMPDAGGRLANAGADVRERFALSSERLSLLPKRLSGRLSFLSKRFPLLPERFSLLSQRFSLLSERFSLLPERFFLAFGILSERLPLLPDHFLQIIEVAVSFHRRLSHLYQSGPNEIALRKGGAHDGQRRQEYAQHFEDGDVVGDAHGFSILSPRVNDGV